MEMTCILSIHVIDARTLIFSRLDIVVRQLKNVYLLENFIYILRSSLLFSTFRGLHFAFDSRTIELSENYVLSWRSLK